MGRIVKALKNLGQKINGHEPAGRYISNVINSIADGYFAVNVEVVTGNVDLLGKVAADLQENIVIGDTGITGKLKYVSDYTGFSSKTAEQSGNYIALKATSNDGAVITGELIGGTKGAVTLDDDGIIIFRVANNNQSVKFVATKDNKSVGVVYALTDLVLEAAPQNNQE